MIHELEFLPNKRTCSNWQPGETCKAGVQYDDVDQKGPFEYRYKDGRPAEGSFISQVASPCFEGADFGCATCKLRKWPKREPTKQVFVGIPTYDDRVHGDMITAIAAASLKFPVRVLRYNSSLLSMAFNAIWSHALAFDASWFLLLHADIVPTTPQWLDVLVGEMDRTGADVLSVISPIKDTRGLTSTGWDWGSKFTTRRLTMKEAMDLPETFSTRETPHADHPLVINTGCMLVDMRRDWVRRFEGFSIDDTLVEEECSLCHGSGCRHCGDRGWRKRVHVQSEDWRFSRWLHEQGCRVYATRAVQIVHHGHASFDNSRPWGSWEVDKGIPELADGK